MTKKVQPYFEERLKEFYELGLPEDVAKELALSKHLESRIYNDQLDMKLVLQKPAIKLLD